MGDALRAGLLAEEKVFLKDVTDARYEVAVLAWQTNITCNIKEPERSALIDACNHSIDDVELPPGPSPTLLRHTATSPISGSILSTVHTDV